MLRFAITDGCFEFGSADFVQLREPGLEARRLAELTRQLLARGSRVLVNDRGDVALACGAHGVHLRDRSVSPALLRRISPPGFVVSVACHSVESVYRAAEEGADYALLAPVFAPLSKPAGTPPLGLGALRQAARAPIPVIALGGITEQNAAQCMEAGAAGVAGITLFRNR